MAESSPAVSVLTCRFCNRKVKLLNMTQHQAICPKSLASCTYRGENLTKEAKWNHNERCESKPHSKDKVERQQPENRQTLPLVHSARTVKSPSHVPNKVNSGEETRKLQAPRPLPSPRETDAVTSHQGNFFGKPITLGERAAQNEWTPRGIHREWNNVVVRQPEKHERKKGTRAPGTSLDQWPPIVASIQDPYSTYQRESDSCAQNHCQNFDKGSDDDCDKGCKTCCFWCACPFIFGGWLICKTISCLLCCD
ncbi:uncharacterized protein LOC144104336 [Amblyomma americanum]